MKRIFLLLVFFLLSCAPTRYIPKDSEPLSQAVYATSESIEKGRIDLADQYAKNAKILVAPPKNPFTINALITKNKKEDIGKTVVIVPSYLVGMDVIVVGSEQYKKLLEIKENSFQLQKELEDSRKEKEEIYKALSDQQTAKTQLLADYDRLVLDLKDKQLALLKRNVIITTMIGGFVIYFLLKINKIISF